MTWDQLDALLAGLILGVLFGIGIARRWHR
jgi:hypothetical protein